MIAWFGDPDQGIVAVEFLGVLDVSGTPMGVIRFKGLELRAVPLSGIHLQHPEPKKED